jgi:hypothetical protein
VTPLRQQICVMVGNGMLLSEILEFDGMPARPTIYRWLRDDQEFAAEYALAREQAADVADERIAELVREVTPANATATRTKIAGLQWRASKLHPQRYGGSATLAIESGDAPAADLEGARNRLMARFDEIADRIESYERSHHFVSCVVNAAVRKVEDRQQLDILDADDRAQVVAAVVQAITPPGLKSDEDDDGAVQFDAAAAE